MLSNKVCRRTLILGGAGVVAGGIFAPARAVQPAATYNEAVQTTWAPLDPAGGQNELVRAATLAVNNHNVQPWTFLLAERRIEIVPDLSRRLSVVDPDNHHLFVSLGCAGENIVQAAGAQGLSATPVFDPVSGHITVTLAASAANRSELIEAITRRQSARSLYDGKVVSTELLKQLAEAGQSPGVELMILTDRLKIDGVRDYVLQGTTMQMNDKAYVKELKSWLRFNESEALVTRDGLFAGTTGNLQLPSWIAPMAFDLFVSASSENDKYAKQIDSSSGMAVFVSAHNDATQWVDVGRAVQRFCLKATALGLKLAFVNQPVEVASIRPQLATFLNVGARRPDIVLRFGTGGPDLPRSLRRPIGDVIS